VCDPRVSQETTIEAVADDPAAWLGRCVTVKGVYNSERLYTGIDAIYGKGAFIGGYVDGRGSVEGFWEGEFTGRVADCAKAENDLLTGLLRSPGISLHERTLGCVRPEGPFLVFMSQGELKPSPLKRRLRGEGDLVPAPQDWPHTAYVKRIAEGFFAAVRVENQQTLKLQLRSDYAVEQLLTADDNAFSALRGKPERPTEVFVQQPWSDDAFNAEVCVCLVDSCKGRWPIAARDADNQKSRPYACVRIEVVRTDGPRTFRYDPSMDFDGLPEPR
jgi:hypothetical protein